jgi:dihydrofolate synthase/folylpolyglutamate synthase
VTYEEALAWLYSTQQFGIKLGLENIRGLLKALNDPQRSLAFVHVAGTNGKGSVCAMLDAVLRASGRRVGLYTSPHLVDFRERIRVGGQKISPEAVASGLSILREISAGWSQPPTLFEIATALALLHFSKQQCDLVVWETGMGGRLDATNAVVPLVSVITPIALDHTGWLGNTLADVAGEKAGIIKAGVPVVSAKQAPEAAAVLIERAAASGSSLEFVHERFEEAEIGLRGLHQKENAALALAALRAIGVEISAAALRQGLRDVYWPGRFQVVSDRLVLDGCHNPHAAEQLVITWQDAFGLEKATLIFGALDDKDYGAMLRILEQISREVFLVPIRSKRSANPQDLAVLCTLPHRIFRSAGEALKASQGRVLVTGSLFLVGEAVELLGLALE